MNLPCLTCDHLIGNRTPIETKEKGKYIIPCQFFLPPVYQNEDEGCLGYIKNDLIIDGYLN